MTWKKILGWIALVIWCLIGLIIIWLPFSNFKAEEIALGMTVLFGVNKIFLVLIIFLLGEKYVQRIKDWFLSWWRKR
jgi:hypothetical protein